jgi:hypothetical protein
MLLALIVLLVCVAVRALRLRARVSRHERLHIVQEGLIRCELWRRASLVAHHDVSGAKTFPLPQETRSRLWRCGGVPIHIEVQSLGLPSQVTDQIGSVGASQFDALFAAPFRLDPAGLAPLHPVQRARLNRL